MNPSDDADRAAFDAVTTGYYRNPDEQLAAGALRHWLRLVAVSDDAQLARSIVLLYLFARISQRAPAARAGFEPILRAYQGPHVELARRLLQAADDPAFPDAVEAPIVGPASLDLLWAEFFVTGQAAPIERICSTLDWDDQIRHRLEAWLGEDSPEDLPTRRATASALAAAGLVVDLERAVIELSGDLDCLCFGIAEQRRPIFTLLPFELPASELTIIATKGAAIWSLRLNARTHETVAAVCRVESQRRGGPARRLAANASDDAPPFVL
jgi:hypothetical protein